MVSEQQDAVSADFVAVVGDLVVHFAVKWWHSLLGLSLSLLLSSVPQGEGEGQWWAGQGAGTGLREDFATMLRRREGANS
jgi:hypothetical protein